MFRKLTLCCAFLALLVIIVGAYVRLTHAGLGCPDWPGCYGKAIVSDSAEFKADAAAGFPQYALDTAKAWKEMTHRYLAGGLAVLVLIWFGLAWKEKPRSPAVMLTASVLLLIAGQAGLGMWAVTSGTRPGVVTAHLLLGFFTFWTLGWSYLRLNPAAEKRPVRSGPIIFTGLAILVLLAQIVLGGWVSSNYAGLACSDFPRCNGEWLPGADYLSILDLFRDSGLSADAKMAIQGLHRVLAAFTFLVLSALMLSATSERYPKPVRLAGNILSLLLLVQIALGIFSVKYQLPLALAVAHNAVAALLMLPLLGILFYSRYSTGTEDESVAFEAVETVATEQVPAEVPQVSREDSLYLRLTTQLKRTRTGLGGVLSSLAFGQKAVTKELLADIEAQLLMADLGIETTTQLIKQLTDSLERDQLSDGQVLSQTLKQNLLAMLEPCSLPLQIPKQDGPFVILVVGVNGAGKTTSIGKLAKRLQQQGHSVMLAAGDTFRAAAVEQLQTWGERNDIQVVAQHTGADSASVIFDALQSAKAKGVDVLIADTAGRLHTKSNLMDELKKIKRIMTKLDESAPHEVLLILDAGTGQNALSQAKLFNEAVELTGIALTKLDGTAKGGIIFALANQLHIPIRFIGVGEQIDDLQDFNAQNFVDALFVQE
ncbi:MULTISPECIES: signal recognition particle-docking protein FtsY [Methylomonas]|uniref:Signal recognition particle receptor FtsY n=2 Tax=Methylomonas TaxID=416 RepID=A0A140E3H3_9GAMM|nr:MULTISPECIES: signal recognition particle-docking protein FtsY [Methylomonas]AMK74947.1 signal recognition particle-docking protein FtsY [Methylomonas denitrificans]OAI05809.1 signal recognition particle-docking protein FtsY [Methylomonas methanica]TCV80982.1 fused signal recognition particle receptor [Methylomonas methanica]